MTNPSPRNSVLAIKAYQGGKSQAVEGIELVKLSSNECAWGPSPKAISAYQAMAGELHRYPEGGATDLRGAIARKYGLNGDHIVCGSGSDELIALLCQAYVNPGDEVVYSAHGFLMYPLSTLAAGGVPVPAPETNLTSDVDALLAAVTDRTRIVFIANPNNPTGTHISGAEVRRLRDGLRDDILLVLDAAYAEFVRSNEYEAGVELVATHDNVVMTRTFSKLYGLAALRLGWAYCPAGVADVLNRVRGPFNVNAAAQAAGVTALEDQAWADQIVADTIAQRTRFQAACEGLGLTVTPSEANFLLVHFPSNAGRTAADADAFLMTRGVIFRRMEGYGLPGALRMSIGTEAENDTAIATLTAFIEPADG